MFVRLMVCENAVVSCEGLGECERLKVLGCLSYVGGRCDAGGLSVDLVA